MSIESSNPEIRITAAAATDFPEIFEGAYWSGFTLSKNPEISRDVIANRNDFARSWRLKSRSRAYIPRPRLKPDENFDHMELFRAEDGALVVIVSNYGGTPPPPALGMQRIPPLYAEDAETFAARYPTLRDLKARLAACNGD